MSLCSRLLPVRSIKCVSAHVQLTQVRWIMSPQLQYNPTHHSYYKIYKHGRGPATAKSLAQVLAEKEPDPRIHYLVDIGLPPRNAKKRNAANSSEKVKVLLKNRSDQELEKQARHKTLEISLEEAQKSWEESLMSEEYCNTAKHFGIYKDLYGDAYFVPQVPLYVTFEQSDAKSIRVFRGNIIKPSQVRNAPSVTYSAEPNSLWSLLLTNPDGHLTDRNSEYIHWFIGNIPGNDVSKGEVIWDYLPPFPPHGTGYQRLIFILYKQEEKLDYSSLQKKAPCVDLSQRTFNTYDFYRERQDLLTPAGLCFYQSTWDQSVKSLYHDTLGMEEPRFLFNFPKQYNPPQRWFPAGQGFDLYLDRYRDPKVITKRYLVKKLKDTHPFEKPPPPLKYPFAQKHTGYVPSWLKFQLRRDRLGCGRIRDV